MNWCSALYIIIAVKINQKRWYRENKLIGMHKNGLILDLNNAIESCSLISGPKFCY